MPAMASRAIRMNYGVRWPATGEVSSDGQNLWKNFLAELSVIGLRIRQVVLAIIIAFK